ncbi:MULTISPECIES: type II toxin-antitoxin system antitoxin SocA domain-containing protein [unclassified Blautia]|uniref:type II toxin-antitoxin system antitoxin SocA domain-containing protein n=1 Tax=unclassified Blautia TaxID=2648079 RepID=UPI003F88D39B
MAEKRRIDFCTVCRKETEYTLQKRNIKKKIKEVEYTFGITVAICDECGEEMSIPGLIDKNIQEVNEQYRAYEGIVSIGDIEKLMKIYKIGKAPLSLALGFGEITITRYLSGQIPSKEYSDIMKRALSSPTFMKEKLRENREKIAVAAYNKAMDAAIQLESLFSVSDKMLRVISYVFERLEEVTPLMLQKLLYFIQGVSYALNAKPMFTENCQAWVHGPVYPEVYDIFRDFKYNPIEDARFVIFECAEDVITEEECRTIDLVVNTFGEYGGKVLERITHEEMPWKLARKGYTDNIPSNETITMENIEEYYTEKNAEYDFSTEKGLKKYIRDILQ